MSNSIPSIPQRPARSQGASALKQEIPSIPPRPHRRSDRSESPHREAFTRSPLNQPPVSMNNGSPYSHGRNLSASDLPRRPPSVNLPSIGQEGNEYSTMESEDETPSGPTEQTRNVSPDLPMHAPKASVPQSTATTRIATVTRTDSSQAAAAGIGKSRPDDDRESGSNPLRVRASFNRSNQSIARPASVHEDEQGIPVIGLQVPMYPNAGDVQAPSPAPGATPHSAGIGFFNDGSSRNHNRRRSSRQEFGPPGSYGMFHGDPKDQFEKAWYQKHPSEFVKETHHQYDPGHPRPEWALSSDDLNKLVHASTNRSAMGASPEVAGTPREEIGYMATEQFASRGTSPKPTPAPLNTLRSRPSSSSQNQGESPLRKTSFPLNETGHSKKSSGDDHALESDVEDDTYGHREVVGTFINEHGNRVPILASDEVQKYPSSDYLQPAVDPEQERRANEYESARRGSETNSRPSSRPSSMHGAPLSRFMSHERLEGSGIGTPLEEIEEYEPLFPDDDDKLDKPKTLADKVKRPDLARHHFPSQDIWEDTPTSLQYTTTVDSPQLPEDEQKPIPPPDASSVFEHPDKEQSRKEELLPSDRADFLADETKKMAKSQFKPGVSSEMRPGNRRFPSSDIWEDSPDSMRLETTVGGPQEEDVTSPTDGSSGPGIPPRPVRLQPSAKSSLSKESSPTERKGPSIPDRPKPQVPARPARVAGDGAPLSKVTSAGSSDGSSSTVTSPPLAKAKPAVPSRPVGNKFAALKAGFMNDLNSRLQLGPQGPPPKAQEPEEAAEEEKAPLADARKGRARGPVRRKPAVTPAAEGVSSASSFSFSGPHTLFHIAEDDEVQVPRYEDSGPAFVNEDIEKAEPDSSSVATTNDVPESVQANVNSGPSTVAPPAFEDPTVAQTGMTSEAVGFLGDTPDPHISEATLERQKAISPALHEALASSAKAAGAPIVPEAETAPSTTEPTGDVSTPATTEAREEPSSGTMIDSSAQTGHHEISITSPQGASEKLTTYLGGRAPEDGNVVVHENGEEHVGGVEEATPRKIGLTGHGM